MTIVVNHRESLFGVVENDIFNSNPCGFETARIWMDLSIRFPSIELDDFCVMPNHFHGIIVINPSVPVGAALVAARNTVNFSTERAGINPAPTGQPTLGEIIGAFKSFSTNAFIKGVRNNGWQAFEKTLWQRNYYEHIIRDEDEFNRIRQYIVDNPNQWGLDNENPNTKHDH